MAAALALGVLQGHRRDQVVEARLVRVRPEERHQPVQGGEQHEQLPADRDPASVGRQALHAKPRLTRRDRLEQG